MEHLGAGPRKIIVFSDSVFITESVIFTWIIMAILIVLAIVVNRNLKERPGKLQSLVETYVDFMYGLVETSMGKHNMGFAPYFSSLFIFLIFGNALGLLHIRPVTADLNTTFAVALITFFCIHFFSIKDKGIKGYIKHMADPMAFLLPINVIGETAFPISLAFRLFGNITGGMIIVELLIAALEALSHSIGIPIPLAEIGLPIFLNAFFDIFEPILQAYIFLILSVTFIGLNTVPHHQKSH